MSKEIAILQSNYIPWRGYFDLIRSVDEFIIYDDMQYTRRDWRNRNKIKTKQGTQWLSIPVNAKGKYFQKIKETTISEKSWYSSHWKSIQLNYRKARYFDEISAILEPLYLSEEHTMLSEVNISFIKAICKYLEIKTKLSYSWDYCLEGNKTDRLVSLVRQAGGSSYTSGPAAKSYIDEEVFKLNGVHLKWFDYSQYKPYFQLWGEFQNNVSIIDLLFNCGPESSIHLLNKKK